jgi:8-oxo-dGTP diphosphatase
MFAVERTANIRRKQYGKRMSVSRTGGFEILKDKNIAGRNDYPIQPVVAVGAIVFKNKRVLLVRRAQPPSRDLWAIPGGKVEIGETLQEAAEREILEETGIIIQAREPVYTFDYIERDGSSQPRFHYVIIDLIADYVRGETRAGDDAADVRWVAAEELASLNVSSKTLRLLSTHYKFGI